MRKLQLIQKFGLKLLISLDCMCLKIFLYLGIICFQTRSLIWNSLCFQIFPSHLPALNDIPSPVTWFLAVKTLGFLWFLKNVQGHNNIRALPRLVTTECFQGTAQTCCDTVFFLYHEYSSFYPLLTAPIATGQLHVFSQGQ